MNTKLHVSERATMQQHRTYLSIPGVQAANLRKALKGDDHVSRRSNRKD